MTRKRVAIIIAALAVTAGVGLAVNEFASAQGGGWGPGFGQHMGFGRGFGGGMGYVGGPFISRALALKNELKLNENQVAKLEQFRDDFYKKAQRERIEMQALRLELQKLYLADKVDVAAAEKQIRAMEKKRGDLRVERLKAIEQAKEVLTPEQIKQLDTFGFGHGPRFGRGAYGPGRGWHMGPGFGPGQGRGWGMMGSGYGRGGYGPGWGMMGPGYGHGGYGPGWGMMGWGTGAPATPPAQQR